MTKHEVESDTIVAIATPSGKGAIGIVLLSGPRAVPLAGALMTLSHGGSVETLPSQKAALGVFHQNGTRVDQVMVTAFHAPYSYTGEDVVEISCHGGTAVLKQILNLFLQSGARLAQPGEFSQRAFLNGKMDLAQAEAVADLINAETELARDAAYSQLEGGLSKTIREVKNILVEVLAHIEVGIDHSDDTSVGATQSGSEMIRNVDACLARLRGLIKSYSFGRLVREGVRISIVGKPNVGKSSLLNCLLKSERAIVTDVPGTTRDTIEEGFDLLGLPAILVDTAGIREKVSDLAEVIGIERTRKAVEKADLVLVLLDANQPLSPEDRKVAELVKGNKKGLVALNKSDLGGKIEQKAVEEFFPGFPSVPVSALTSAGIDELLNKLYALAASMEPGRKVSPGDILVTHARHLDCLERAEEALVRARAESGEDQMEECAALEIREALDSLGEIIGEVVTEDILNEIFAKFCIGK